MKFRLFLENEIIPAEDVLRIIMGGYYQQKNGVNPEVYTKKFGVQGDFVRRTIPTEKLVWMVNRRMLFISPSKTEQGVLAKVNSGERNPIIITKPQNHSFPYMVIDGTHSLDAAVRAGDKTVEVIMPVDMNI